MSAAPTPRPADSRRSRISPIIASVFALLAPVAAEATDVAAKHTLVDRQSERRVVVTLAPSDAELVVFSETINRDVMAYRFRLEAVDRFGHSRDLPAIGALAIRVGTVRGPSQVELTSSAREFTLPRPFGIRLGSDDSLVVALAWVPADAEEVTFRISIDYEPAERARTRLSVNSVRADAGVEAGARSRAWEWQPTQDGRVLAMTGVRLDGVEAIQLIDVESGAVLWDASRGGQAVGGAVPVGAAVRLGVSVRADRRYRLVVTFAEPQVTTERVTEVITAVILPSA